MRPSRFKSLFWRKKAFSLVEVVIAIGIFSFVIVGIIGVFPMGLKARSESSLEARGALMARQIFESIQTKGSLENVSINTGILNKDSTKGNFRIVNFKPPSGGPPTEVTLGYSVDGITPNHLFDNGSIAWSGTDLGPPEQTITTKLRVKSELVERDLYNVTITIGYPANLPADKRRTVTYSQLVHSPS
jgi:type II secretory pathway pseudopilin PulG